MPLLLEIVTPERLAFSEDVDSVQVPGIDGELGILPHHAPLVSLLHEGRARGVFPPCGRWRQRTHGRWARR